MYKGGGGMTMSLGGFATFAGKPTRANQTLRLCDFARNPRAQQDRIPPNPGYGPIPHQKANVGT